jgi:translocation and assembly module TamB
MKRYALIAGKVLLWITGTVLGLLLLIIIAFQFTAVQNLITSKLTAYVSSKTGSVIRLEAIKIAFPRTIWIKGLYVEGQKKDTILYAGKVSVGVDLMKLVRKKLEVNNITLENITAHISRSLPDSSFNFDFIAGAFADTTAKQAVKDTAKSGWKISLKGLDLRSVYFTFADSVSGNDVSLRLGRFEMDLTDSDLENMKFDIDGIELENTSFSLVQSKPAEDDKEEGKPADIRLRRVRLKNVHIKMDNKVSRQVLALDIGSSELKGDKMDLPRQQIGIRSFSLSNSNIIYSQGFLSPEDSLRLAVDTASGPPSRWVVTIGSIRLKDNNIAYSNFNRKTVPGLDFNHLFLAGLRLEADNVLYSSSSSKIDLKELSFRDKSGFTLKSFRSAIVFDSTHAELKDLDIRTPLSRIGDYVSVSYPSLAALADSIGNMTLKIHLRNTSVALADILLFQPGLRQTPPFSGDPGVVVRLNTLIEGPVKDLAVKTFSMSSSPAMLVSAEGRIKGLPDMSRTYFNMRLNRMVVTEKDIRRLIPRKMLPSNLDIPSTIAARGYFTGTLSDFDSDLKINTDIGTVTGRIRMYPDGEQVKFTAVLNVDAFQLGSFLKKPDQFGPVSLKIEARGRDLTSPDLAATIDAIVPSAIINRYEYKDFTLKGFVTRERFKGKAGIKDNNLVFSFDGDVSTEKDSSYFKFTFDLNGADLKALNFTEDDVRVSGRFVSDLKGSSINDFNGNAAAQEIMVIKNGKKYPVDSLVFASVNQDRQTEINIESPLLSASFKGNIVLGDLAKVLKEHLNTYFDLRDTSISKSLEAQDFTFRIELKDPSLFTDVIVPKLKRLQPGIISGSYSSNDKKLSMNFDLPELEYDGIRVMNLSSSVSSDRERISYTLQVGEMAKDTLKIRNTSLTGDIRDSVNMQLRIADEEKKDRFLITAHINNSKDGMSLRFNDPQAILNYETWTMPADNYIRMGKKGLYAHNIRLQKEDRYFSMDNTSPEKLEIKFNRFTLSSLSGLIETYRPLLGGEVNGYITITETDRTKAFVSDVSLKSFSFMGDTLGDVKLKADNRTGGLYSLEASVTGRGNDILAGGTYRILNNKESALDLKVDLRNVNLATLTPYTFGALKQLSGSLKGRLSLSGSTSAPDVNGYIAFNQSLLKPAYTNSPVTITNGRIVFNKDDVRLENITFRDSLQNTGSLKGTVTTEAFKNIRYDLALNTSNFLVLNTHADDTKLYYGTVFLDSDIGVKGDTELPLIKARLRLKEPSAFVFVKPEVKAVVEEYKGVVVFEDTSAFHKPIMERQDTTGIEGMEKIKGINLTAHLELTEGASIKVLIDKESGDSLMLSGTSNLLFAMDPSGKTTLSGDLRMIDGAYQLSFSPLVKRRFEIQKGSTIVWNGEPTSAIVNLTAMYTIKTSAIDLVKEQLAGSPEEEKNMYKQKLPFQVFLMIKGDMLKPEITFDIQLPPKHRDVMDGSVNAKLNQIKENQAELEKQVFALLVLGRFISDNPFESSENTGGLETTARNSVSQMLSDQLNKLSDKYVKGVNLSMGVESYEDYSSGTAQGRTQLQLGLSKNLFNDRVEVQVGGSVDVEGERAKENNVSNLAGDVSVEYRLTPDGRYRLKGFRRRVYEGVIEGELVETGAGVLFIRNFNKMKEIFGKSEKEEKEDNEPATGPESID